MKTAKVLRLENLALYMYSIWATCKYTYDFWDSNFTTASNAARVRASAHCPLLYTLSYWQKAQGKRNF